MLFADTQSAKKNTFANTTSAIQRVYPTFVITKTTAYPISLVGTRFWIWPKT